MIYAIGVESKRHAIYTKGAPLGTEDFRLVNADADGWIEWHGGECPLPEGAKFDYKMRDGRVVCSRIVKADEWWGSPIIAYLPILDTKPEAPEWDGVGLPPVGCECEMEGDNGAWFPVIPVAYGWRDRVCCYAESNGGRLDALAIFAADPDKFRPIRSAEDEAVEEMLAIIENAESAADCCQALYRAGYRKE